MSELDQATELARAAGVTVDGWFVCRDDTGYCVWLYTETAGSMESIFPDVPVFPDFDAAAAWCLAATLEITGQHTGVVGVA